MNSSANKVMIIGWDGAVGPRVIKWAQDGELPAIKFLIDEGIYAAHCLAPHPTITPPNWTAIATGAWPGTHGITDFKVHNPGDPLLVEHQGFDARESQAEFLWDAAARGNKRSIILNWPTSYGAEPDGGICIGGYGVGPNEWRYHVPPNCDYEADLADDQLFAVGSYPESTPLEFAPPHGWKDVPEAKSLLEADLPVQYRKAHREIKTQVTWHLLVVDAEGDGYDEVILSESKAVNRAFARLHVGEWSAKLVKEFETSGGPVATEFRVKLEALEPDLSDVRIYVTAFCNIDGWSHPPGTTGEIKSENGLPMPEAGYSAACKGWISPETYLELGDMWHDWQVDATRYLLKNKPWDLFFTQYHLADFTYHRYSRMMEPSLNEADPEYYQELELQVYKRLDRALARTIELADQDTLVIVVSDHGCKATTGSFVPAKLLVEAGLTAFEGATADEPVRVVPPDPGTWGPEKGGIMDRTVGMVVTQGSGKVDWSKTRAIMQRSAYIYVNLKGRDPNGIVEPGEEYEQLCDEIIKLLYDYTDPVTGKKPVMFALRKEDARMIGHWGDRVGDIVFATTGWFGREHGVIAPTARYGRQSMEALFVMAGPGVKKGREMERTMWLVDIVPTICHIAELPLPEQCEGAVLYQALTNPDGKIKELKRLRNQIAQGVRYGM